MNESIMLAWLQDVVLTYTNAEPAALILDQYSSHFTEPVLELAERLRIQIILVPAGQTSTLQPLDVGINGPMLKLRQKIWREKKQYNPAASDSWQAAVERAQVTYERLNSATISQSFVKTYLID